MLSFYADSPILDKLFDVYPFVQTVIPHENHVDGFFTEFHIRNASNPGFQ